MEEDTERQDTIDAAISQAVRGYFDALISGLCPVCQRPVQEEQQIGRCVYARPCGHRLFQGQARKRGNMINRDLVRWRYIRPGDMLEYRDREGTTREIGPVLEITLRQDANSRYAPEKRAVFVPAPGQESKKIDVPLRRVQAVFRGGTEVIRFTDGEQQETGCAACGQRRIDGNVAGGVFCSLACQLDWIERYYQEYAPGENPIDKGVYIHTTNCDECRRLNRVYCPRCVD